MESAAPYDTTFTPEYRLKIIGGKPTYVADYSNRNLATHMDKTRPAAPLPQSLPSTGHSSGRSERSSAEQRNTWTSHSVLPPIMTPRQGDSPATRSNLHSGDRGYSNDGQGDRSPYLPNEPIMLEKMEEMELLKSLGASLQSHNMDILKHIYNELSATHDQNLTGWVSYVDVSMTLNKCQVHLSPDDLKTAASLFVAPDRPGYVNYERLLSLLASAIKLNTAKKDPQYFAQSGEKQYSNLDFLSINTRAPRPANEVSGAHGKLIRLVEVQLSQGEFPMDLERLRNQFTMADRLHRDSLSHGEIKEICYRNRVPLQESVINHVLDRCRTTGDGQYRWTDFIDFLETVQPIGTGLMITSKQPSEYVKKLPEPKDSWPHPEFANAEPPSTYKHAPRVPYEEQANSAASSHRSTRTARDSQQNPISQQNAPEPYQSVSQLAYGSQVPSASRQSRTDCRIMQSDAVQTDSALLRSDSVQTDLLPKRLQQGDGEESWLDRFGKLAQALYRNDLDKNGVIKANEFKWLITEYNDVYGLEFSKDTIEQTIQRTSTAKGTDIDSALKELLQTAQ